VKPRNRVASDHRIELRSVLRAEAAADVAAFLAAGGTIYVAANGETGAPSRVSSRLTNGQKKGLAISNGATQ